MATSYFNLIFHATLIIRMFALSHCSTCDCLWNLATPAMQGVYFQLNHSEASSGMCFSLQLKHECFWRTSACEAWPIHWKSFHNFKNQRTMATFEKYSQNMNSLSIALPFGLKTGPNSSTHICEAAERSYAKPRVHENGALRLLWRVSSVHTCRR